MEKSNVNIKEIKHVIIDYREKSLIEKINSLLEIKTENLPKKLGSNHIYINCNLMIKKVYF